MLHNQAPHVDEERNGNYSLPTPNKQKQRLPPRRGQIKKKIFSKLIKAVVSLMAGTGSGRENGGGREGNSGGCLEYSTSKTSPQDV